MENIICSIVVYLVSMYLLVFFVHFASRERYWCDQKKKFEKDGPLIVLLLPLWFPFFVAGAVIGIVGQLLVWLLTTIVWAFLKPAL